MSNKSPFLQQTATGSDGRIYQCVTPGDEIVDGVVRNNEEWTCADDANPEKVYTRSERDILSDTFDGANFE